MKLLRKKNIVLLVPINTFLKNKAKDTKRLFCIVLLDKKFQKMQNSFDKKFVSNCSEPNAL